MPSKTIAMARMKPSGRNPGFACGVSPDCAAERLHPGYLLLALASAKFSKGVLPFNTQSLKG